MAPTVATQVAKAVARAPQIKGSAKSKRRKLFRAAYRHERYVVDEGKPCEYCGAALLALERVSVAGCKLNTPCCNNGKVRLPLPSLPADGDMEVIYGHPSWPEHARAITHRSNFVTTYVHPRDGRAFHSPLPAPCCLYLQGTAMHWLRPNSHASDGDQLADINNAVEQLWITPDKPSNDPHLPLLTEWFQDELRECNPATRALITARELGGTPQARQQDVYLKYQYGDAGPDVTAIFHTAQPDNVPPELLQYTWRLENGVPRSRKLPRDMSDALTFPTLFPTGVGTFRSGVTLYDTKHDCFHAPARNKMVTVTQAARFLMFNQPWWWKRSARVVQEYMLHQFNAAETARLAYFLGSEKAGTGDGADAEGDGDAGDGAVADDDAYDHMGAAHDDGRQPANAEALGPEPQPGEAAGDADGDDGERKRAPSFIPANFTGGPRFFQGKLNDVLTAAAKFGTNNILFITLSAHSHEDFIAGLTEGAPHADQNSAMARAFECVRAQVLKDLVEGVYLPVGREGVRADYYIDVNEWQKRGAPHSHIVIHFPGELWTADEVDSFVWAHVPTAEEEARFPGITALVNKFMVHDHSPRCMPEETDAPHEPNGPRAAQDKRKPKHKCSFGFPKPPCAETHRTESGRWVLWRRESDKWIAAYIPLMLLRLKRHANAEPTAGTASIGYLFQYPLKGDATIRAAIAEAAHPEGGVPGEKPQKVDEVGIYQSHRCVSSSEAIFRLAGFNLVKAHPPVSTVKVLLDHQKFIFGRGKTAEEKQAAKEKYHTHAEQWFKRPDACQDVGFRDYFEEWMRSKTCPKRAVTHRDYTELAADGVANGQYVYKRADPSSHLVFVVTARMQTAQFYARLLLLQPDCRARSWVELRTVDGDVHDTYAAAASALGLLEDHESAVRTMREFLSSQLTTPRRARTLFLLVIESFKCDASAMLDEFADHMLEADWLALDEDDARTYLLAELQRSLDAEGRSLATYEIEAPAVQPHDEPLVQTRYTNGSIVLNPDQQAPFDHCVAHLSLPAPTGCLLVHMEGEPGGGKTTFLNCLLNWARAQGHKCLPAAFPAKVARKFRGGQTAHYWLGMNSSKPGHDVTLGVAAPDDFSEGVTPMMRRRGARLLAARLLFIDEITMMRAEQLDALVRMLLRLGFCGVFIIVGNCAQLGAVLPGLGISEQIFHSIVKADTFHGFTHFRLTGQMRCHDNELRQAIHDIGYGDAPPLSGVPYSQCPRAHIRMDRTLFQAKEASPDNIEEMRRWVHGDVNARDPGAPLQGSIVCSTVARAEEHNDAMLDQMHGDAVEFLCTDEVVPVRDGKQQFEAHSLTAETSRAINGSGQPPSMLRLKEGAPVHIMAPLDREAGLVKGELATVVEINRRTVVVKLQNPDAAGQDTFALPRVNFTIEPEESKLPVSILRRQFPLRLAWASTVHRVQGDDLTRIVVDMRDEYFAHGQLHVAVSRGHSREETWFLVNPEDLHDDWFRATNVVIPEVLYKDD